MDFYKLEVAEAFDQVKSSEAGLTTQEAEKRLQANGKNKLKEAPKDSLIKRFLSQLTDPMIIILLVNAVLAYLTRNKKDDDEEEDEEEDKNKPADVRKYIL